VIYENRLRQQLAQRAAELDAIIEAIPDGVYIGDVHSLTHINGAGRAMLGLPATGTPVLSGIMQQLRSRDAATLRPLVPEEHVYVRALHGETAVSEVVVRHLQTGEDRVMRSAAAPIQLDGAIVGAVAINTDITERIRGDAKIRQSEALYRAIAGSLPGVLVLVFDRELRFLLVEGGIEPGRRLARENLEGRTLRESTPEKVSADFEAPFRAALEGRSTTLDYVFGGRSYDVHCVPLADDRGEVFAGLVVALDLTERKEIEKQLRQDVEFRERFMAILGHDLRNPLAAISLTVQQLQRLEELPRSVPKGLARVANSADRMDRMIHALLDFTRSRHGGIPLSRAAVDLRELCREVVAELEVAHPERSFILRGRGDVSGEWDRDRIAQVVSNLTANALQHGAPGAPIALVLAGLDGEVTLCIHNQGRAIPPADLAHIFDPFRKLRKTAGGLGLGLYIVRQIVVAHGGRVEVSSGDGGTRFTVHLPKHP
jgi:PAS domain S-box-containing protein